MLSPQLLHPSAIGFFFHALRLINLHKWRLKTAREEGRIVWTVKPEAVRQVDYDCWNMWPGDASYNLLARF